MISDGMVALEDVPSSQSMGLARVSNRPGEVFKRRSTNHKRSLLLQGLLSKMTRRITTPNQKRRTDLLASKRYFLCTESCYIFLNKPRTVLNPERCNEHPVIEVQANKHLR